MVSLFNLSLGVCSSCYLLLATLSCDVCGCSETSALSAFSNSLATVVVVAVCICAFGCFIMFCLKRVLTYGKRLLRQRV